MVGHFLQWATLRVSVLLPFFLGTCFEVADADNTLFHCARLPSGTYYCELTGVHFDTTPKSIDLLLTPLTR